MKLNEEKSNYIIFTKAREEFAARLTLNEKLIERKKVTKIVGVWLEERGGWAERRYSKGIVVSCELPNNNI